MAEVSIVIPVYNGERFLKECIESLQNQTLKDIEIICVDDGSTDGSYTILEAYAEQDDRIKIIRQQNCFAGAARNNGMKVASGRYIMFLDADDFFAPEMLEKMYGQISHDDADICICDATAYSETEKTFKNYAHYLKEDLIPEKMPFTPSDVKNTIFQITTPSPWNKMFKAEYIEELGITFDTIKRANDLYFVYTALVCAKKITVVKEKYVNYRTDVASSLQGTNEEGTFEFVSALTHLKTELGERHIWADFEKSFLNRTLSTCLFNLDKTKSKADFISVYNKLKDDSFYNLGILNHSKGYYYVKAQYVRLVDIINKPAEDAWEGLYGTAKEQKPESVSLENWEKPQIKDELPEIKVSVIIPVYNVEDYLGECLDSVINQTLKEIEIICVNDGSTDSSLDIVKKYADTDIRIKIVDKENGGLSSARNAGMEKASGEYVYFLDSDDSLKLRTLEFLYYKAKAGNLDQLYFSAEIFYDGCSEQHMEEDSYIRKADYSQVKTGRDLFYKMAMNAEFKPSVCIQFFKREFLQENKLEFKEGIIHEDNLFTVQCMWFADKVEYIDINLYNRRVREDSIMTDSQNFKHAYNYYVVVKELEEFAYRHNIKEDKEFFKALKKQIQRILIQIANFLEQVSEEELEKIETDSQTDLSMSIYMATILALRQKSKELVNRAHYAEESLAVADFRNKFQQKSIQDLLTKNIEKNNRIIYLKKQLKKADAKTTQNTSEIKRRTLWQKLQSLYRHTM